MTAQRSHFDGRVYIGPIRAGQVVLWPDTRRCGSPRVRATVVDVEPLHRTSDVRPVASVRLRGAGLGPVRPLPFGVEETIEGEIRVDSDRYRGLVESVLVNPAPDSPDGLPDHPPADSISGKVAELRSTAAGLPWPFSWLMERKLRRIERKLHTERDRVVRRFLGR